MCNCYFVTYYKPIQLNMSADNAYDVQQKRGSNCRKVINDSKLRTHWRIKTKLSVCML